MTDKKDEITRILIEWTDGDKSALERLMPLVMEELRKIARGYMDRERVDHTLQPTALINELYLHLVDRKRVNWKNRAHFFGFTAQMMRRILVDHARTRLAGKRGAGVKPLPIDEKIDQAVVKDRELVALDDALIDLERLHERQAKVVVLRYFAGLTYDEIGEVLGVSGETVKRDFRVAKIWLKDYLKNTDVLDEPHEKTSPNEDDEDSESGSSESG